MRGDDEGFSNGTKAWKYVLADLARYFQLIIAASVVVGWFTTLKDLPRNVENERRERIEADGKIIEQIGQFSQWRENASVGLAREEERISSCCPRWEQLRRR